MTDDDVIAEMLMAWEDARERGEPVAAEGLCGDQPGLLDALRERIGLLGRAGWMRSPAQEPPRPPRTLAGRYALEQLIGSGGYAQVWRAYDLQLHRHVAVKVPRPSRTVTPAQVEEVLTEARQVARLRHVNVITVHDVVKEGAGFFIVTDLVDGETLAERLRRGPLPPAEAARLLAEVARVIDYAHGQGVVHRDLKPANVFLDKAGRPHVGDFGLARPTKELLGGSDQRGTPAYSSPEQLDGQPLDGRSDLWSLGVILYETLAGRPPFADDNPVRLRQAIAAANVPEAPRVPAALMAVCRRCMAKTPEGRFSRGDDVAAALERAVRGGPAWRTVLGATLAVLAVGAVVGGTLSIRQGQPGPGVARQPEVDEQGDRAVAGWVLTRGGRVKYMVDGDGQVFDADTAAALPATPCRLTEIDLHGCQDISDDDVGRLAGLPDLQRLKLTQTPVTDAGVRRLGRQGGELEWLDLTGTKATAASLPVAVAKLQPDGVLLLGGLPLGDGDLHHLLQKPTMRALALNYTQVTDRGMAAVARCERLHFLDLSGTKLTAAGVRTLYALKRLEYLTLTDVKLDAGVVEALKGLTWVKQITLGQADPEMAERLRQALPRCKIVSSLDNTAPADPTAGGSRPPTRRR